MFSHIVTNIKDTSKLKDLFESESTIKFDSVKREIYNLTEILNAKDEKLLNNIFYKIKTGRKDNVLVILYLDHMKDIEKINKNEIMTSNCLILKETI
ncbi:TPA: hypothetical protein N2D99_002106 [Clostridium botulinum]|nr:hypothetical protein [Clostridium botulinum]